MIDATYIGKSGNEKGAGGKLAIWASKTYRGQCMPPKEDMLADNNQNHPNYILFTNLCSLIIPNSQD